MSARVFAGGKLLLASHNRGKLVEIADLLAPFEVGLASVADLGLPEPEETGMTFLANAELKARAAALAANLPALSDDSGLAVDALDGAPGIYSARWAGADKDFARAMRRVEDELEKRGKRRPDQRRARFICALSLCWPDGHCESFEGKVEGWIAPAPRGAQGFGYDPIFVPLGERRSFGEFAPAEKHAVSHRADAFRQLVAACFGPAGATRR